MVRTAAIVTWVGAGTTALFTLLATVVFGPVVATLLEAFGGGQASSWGWVAGTGVLVLALCGLAAVCAHQVTRGRRWARWLLVCLSVLTVLAGLALFALGISLVIAAAAVAVIVLLLVPEAGAWFGNQQAVNRG